MKGLIRNFSYRMKHKTCNYLITKCDSKVMTLSVAVLLPGCWPGRLAVCHARLTPAASDGLDSVASSQWPVRDQRRPVTHTEHPG